MSAMKADVGVMPMSRSAQVGLRHHMKSGDCVDIDSYASRPGFDARCFDG